MGLLIVFVVGPSGGGKSLFVEEVTKSGLVKVGIDLRPRTKTVQAIRCELTEGAKTALGATKQNNIVFVDTPSFHTAQNDGVAEKEMKNWLSKSKSKSTRSGTIYMHRIEADPRYESTTIQDHLNTFAYAFPQNFVSLPGRVHAVLSYEGIISEDRIQPRRVKFQEQLDNVRSSRCQGLGTLTWVTSSHPDLFKAGDSETAWRAVVELFSLIQA
ncbi:hypothetical protein OG21DRAFT_1601377 [Imleria badia]|nr:hypothetical protein OG21DRAFT_1601377 [Imleria badia]